MCEFVFVSQRGFEMALGSGLSQEVWLPDFWLANSHSIPVPLDCASLCKQVLAKGAGAQPEQVFLIVPWCSVWAHDIDHWAGGHLQPKPWVVQWGDSFHVAESSLTCSPSSDDLEHLERGCPELLWDLWSWRCFKTKLSFALGNLIWLCLFGRGNWTRDPCLLICLKHSMTVRF